MGEKLMVIKVSYGELNESIETIFGQVGRDLWKILCISFAAVAAAC